MVLGPIVSNDLLAVRVHTPVCDESWQACRRRSHFSDGFFERPGRTTDRFHQYQGRSLTPHRKTAYASLRTAPSGMTPVSRNRHSATSNCRATATQALSKPATQRTLRLVTHPTPGQLRGHPAHVPIPCLGHPVFPGALSALIQRRDYPRSAPDLAADNSLVANDLIRTVFYKSTLPSVFMRRLPHQRDNIC
jgi:hypothetical protein